MTKRIVSAILASSCPKQAPDNNCTNCQYFCGIKQAQFDCYEVECGAKEDKKGEVNGNKQ